MNQESTAQPQDQQTQTDQSKQTANTQDFVPGGDPSLLEGQKSNGVWPPKGFEDDQDLSRYKDLDSVAKTLKEQKKMISSSVRIPGEDATEEDWGNFYSKLRPEKPEDYKVELKLTHEDGTEEPFELPENVANLYKELAHENGITQKQFNNFLQSMLVKEQQMQSELKQQGERNLKDEWGKDYAKNAAIANQMEKRLGDDARSALKQLPFEQASKLLLEFGKHFVENVSPKDVQVKQQNSIESLDKEINQLMRDAFRPENRSRKEELLAQARAKREEKYQIGVNRNG